MMRSRTLLVIAGLLLVASAAGTAGHFYFRLSRSDAVLLALLVLTLGVLQTASLLWIARPSRPEPVRDAAQDAGDLARQLADLERRLAALEVQVAAAKLDAETSEPARQDPVLRARARAELALAAAAIGRK